MDLEMIMKELESLGTEQNKRIYMNHGAKEPIFGVTDGKMKPIAKKIKKNQILAEALYQTSNYDAMRLAGMIADPQIMKEVDFERWINQAYTHMLSDYVVAVSLAETVFAEKVANEWISSGLERKMSAGWSCYEWLLGSRPDEIFDREDLKAKLDYIKNNIHKSPERTKYAMNGFVITVAISYIPLHEDAVLVAAAIGKVSVTMGKTNYNVPIATKYIEDAKSKGRLGFKRKNVRC